MDASLADTATCHVFAIAPHGTHWVTITSCSSRATVRVSVLPHGITREDMFALTTGGCSCTRLLLLTRSLTRWPPFNKITRNPPQDDVFVAGEASETCSDQGSGSKRPGASHVAPTARVSGSREAICQEAFLSLNSNQQAWLSVCGNYSLPLS